MGRNTRNRYLPSHLQAEIIPVASPVEGQTSFSENLSLAKSDVHIWFVHLLEMSQHIDSLFKILAQDEVARAAQFRFESDRNEYIVARGILRHILSSYVGFGPNRLQFCYSVCGKPALAVEWGGDQIAFNVSHSCGVVVYALAKARQVGVDLEYTNRCIESDQIAERFFSPREASLLRQSPAQEKQRAFFSCWTRKEAYVKARGEGLSVDLRGFDVTFAPGEPVSLLSVADDPNEAQRWSLYDLPAPTGYVGALAAEGTVSRIMHLRLPTERVAG
jgi:4'-phosphopantetheinyl transferase